VAIVAALIGGSAPSAGPPSSTSWSIPTSPPPATAHLSAGAAARFLVTTFNSGFGHGFAYAYFVGIFAAPALMGYAPD